MAEHDAAAHWAPGGLRGLGLLALASSRREPVRQSFGDTLKSELANKGIRLVSAELGRRQGDAVWVVACETHDDCIQRVEVAVVGAPYDDPEQLAVGVAEALRAA